MLNLDSIYRYKYACIHITYNTTVEGGPFGKKMWISGVGGQQAVVSDYVIDLNENFVMKSMGFNENIL